MREESTLSELVVREAQSLTFDQLPEPVVHEAKRRILDTLACAAGGFDSAPSRMAQSVVRALGGTAESTIFVSGDRTSCAQAALVNGVMIRHTEGVDKSIEGRDGVVFHGHPCEIIPSVLAVGERERSSGRAILTSVVLGYELQNRVMYAAGGANVVQYHGWKHEIRAGLVVPLVAGILMGLGERQLVNAVGIAGCYAGALGLLDEGNEEVTMARDLRFPLNAHQGIVAALLAREGFEGPRRVYEGEHGFIEVMFRGKFDRERLLRRDDEFNIMYTWAKAYPFNGRLQAQTEGLLRLVGEHDLTPERISRIRIRTSPKVVERMGDPAHRYPRTKETADASAYYSAAVVVVDRAATLAQFAPDRMSDPRVRETIDKIEIVAVPEWTEDQAPTEIEITAVDGATHACRVDHPKGHLRNPMTDRDIEEKFRGMAAAHMGEDQMRRIFEKVWALDDLADVAALTRSMAASAVPA